MKLPTPAAIEELLGLARMGMLVKVEQLAQALEQREPGCAAFARNVWRLAHSFEEDALVAFLQRCLESPSHADAS
jgi:hypothetical protein